MGLLAVLKTDLWLIPDPLDLTDRCESKLEELTDENPERMEQNKSRSVL